MLYQSLGINIVKKEYTLVYGKDCKFKKKNLKINVMNSGITMRFLTATFYQLEVIIFLMEFQDEKRPIKSLVESLKNIGCQIYYKKMNGFPLKNKK